MLSKSILSRCLGRVHSYQEWDNIHKYFTKQTRAQARQLHTELRSVSLKDRSMHAFLLKVQEIANALASVGIPISPQEHMDALLEEVEALLLAHEAQLHKFDEWFDPPSVNLTHAYGADSYPAQNKFQQPESENFALRGGFGRGGDHSRGGRHGGARGGSGHFANFQCQVSNEILLQGSIGPDGLYSFPTLKLQSFPVKSSASCFVSNSSNSNSVFPNCSISVASMEPKSSNLWHARLGHPNFYLLRSKN
ncbi:hypothetical protein GmHk_16G047238 [Glycine max]|nr:hypothetical protein GmHk_16G047238 [Glycine max]